MKKKKTTKNLHVLPPDCWSHITSFFSSWKDAFNILLTSKKLNEIFRVSKVKFFKNVLFNVKSFQSTFRNSKQKGKTLMENFRPENTFNYVSSCSIWIRGIDDVFYGDSRIYIFSKKDVEQNTRNLSCIIRSFPNLRHLKIKSPDKKSPSRYDSSSKSNEEKKKEDFTLISCEIFGHDDCFSRLNALHFNGLGCIDKTKDLLSHLGKLQYLRDLTLENIAFETPYNPDFDTKLEHMNSLRRLSLRNVYGMNSLLDSHENLESLELVKYHLIRYTSLRRYLSTNRYTRTPKCLFPNLLNFIYSEKLDGESIFSYEHPTPSRLENHKTNVFPWKKVVKSCSDSIEFLSLKNYASYSDYSRFSDQNDNLISQCRNLRHLKISGKKILSGNFLLHCEKIRILDLSSERCLSLSKIPPVNKNIIELNISCPNSSSYRVDNDNSFLSKFPNLERLIMNKCCQFDRDINPKELLNFRTLKYLSIVDCDHEDINEEFIKKLFQSNLELKKIRIFDDYCIERNEDLTFSARKVDAYIHTFEALDCGEGYSKLWFVPDRFGGVLECKKCEMFIKPFECAKCKKFKCVCEASFCPCMSRTGYKETYCKECDAKQGCAGCEKNYCYRCTRLVEDVVYCKWCCGRYGIGQDQDSDSFFSESD